MKKFVLLGLAAMLITVMVIAQVASPTPTGEALLDESTSIFEAVGLAQQGNEAFKEGTLAGIGWLCSLIVVLLRLPQTKNLLWNKVSSRWRVLIVLGVNAIVVTIVALATGGAPWYLVVYGTVFASGTGVLTKKILWNAIGNNL